MNSKALRHISEKEWYYGNLSDDEKMQHGIGLKRERDGSIFYGCWEKGLRSGFGSLCETDGGLTVANWKDDKLSDIILTIFPQGNTKAIFCGKSEQGRPKEGMLLCADGKLYYGIFTEWRKDNFDGEGAILWPDKRIYAGRWKNGGTDIGGVIRRADGRMTGTLSNVRTGYSAKSWQGEAEKHFFYGITDDEEVRNSNGVLFYASGEFFAGEMRGGQRTGFGIYRGPKENIYIGDWENGVMQGRGMCIRWTADIVSFFVGEFKDNLYDGEGCTLCRMHGKWDFLYQGAWKDGKKSGVGILNLNEGKVYVGGFSEDLRDGDGDIIASDGTCNSMKWKMGTPELLLEQVKGPGPLRDQFSKKEKLSLPILNSLIDGEEFGEEQFFVGIRAGANTPYQRTIQIEPGCDYEIRIFYHNDADTTCSGEEGSVTKTRLRAFFTNVIRPGEEGVVSAAISSEGNTIPVIWDGITFQSAEELCVSYKIASARLYNNRKKEGCILPQALFTEDGVYLGTDELNGILPPGSSGYVTFIVQTSGKRRENSASFSQEIVTKSNQSLPKREESENLHKTHAKETGKKRRRSRISIGITAFDETGEPKKQVYADIGEELDVKVAFTNSASNQDITISVSLPSTVEFVKGSSILELSDGSRSRQSDQWIHDGLGLLNFFSEGEGEIRFKLRYFPDDMSDVMKVEAMIETADVVMRSELQMIQR